MGWDLSSCVSCHRHNIFSTGGWCVVLNLTIPSLLSHHLCLVQREWGASSSTNAQNRPGPSNHRLSIPPQIIRFLFIYYFFKLSWFCDSFCSKVRPHSGRPIDRLSIQIFPFVAGLFFSFCASLSLVHRCDFQNVPRRFCAFCCSSNLHEIPLPKYSTDKDNDDQLHI